MKIIIPKKITTKIYNQVVKHSPNETKGALFAEKLDNTTFKIDDVYFESKVGNIAFVELINNNKYKKYQKNYHKQNNYDYTNHNYIGDWHSHPMFELFPSNFDQQEVIRDLEKSNAKFLIQIIVKVINNKLIGNAFYYDRYLTAKKIELFIENEK